MDSSYKRLQNFDTKSHRGTLVTSYFANVRFAKPLHHACSRFASPLAASEIVLNLLRIKHIEKIVGRRDIKEFKPWGFVDHTGDNSHLRTALSFQNHPCIRFIFRFTQNFSLSSDYCISNQKRIVAAAEFF